jgi:hypothetical protein
MRSFKTLLFALVILWSGCGDINYSLKLTPPVPYFAFSLNFPPKILLRPDTNTVLLINRVDLSKQHVTQRDLDVLKAGAFTALKYAGGQLAALPHVRVINLTDSVNFEADYDSLQVISAKYHADYILALVQYGADVSFDGTYESHIYSNNKADVKLTIYVGGGSLYKDISGSAMLQRRQRTFGLAASELVRPSLPGNKDYIIEATKNATFNALLDYLPYTETENRPIYNDKKFGSLADELMAGHLDKAGNLLQPFLNDRDQALACKAAYNAAVVYEARGDLDNAMKMAQLSLDKSKNNYAGNLISYLKSKQAVFP